MEPRHLIMVMKRGHFKYPPANAGLFSGVFKIANLEHYGQVLNKKNPAKNRDHDLLPDHDGKYSYNTSESQAPCITHKDLSRVRIVPEKTYTGPDKSAYINYKFTGIWDVHNIQIIGENEVT